jgi:hypothetical protein
MPVHAVTPREVFEHWLEQQPDTARVVLACDTDRLLAESKALDNPDVTDPQGRSWRLVVFRGDDVRFRLAFRKAAASGDRIAIVILGPGDPDQRVDVSTIGDLLAKHEGHEVLDLSLARYLSRFCPQINFPPVPLRHYRQQLLAHTGELSGAAKKITARWGKPDDWGRAQVAALTLLASAPHLALDDIWPDGDRTSTYLAHALRSLLARPELAAQRAVVLDLAETAALPGVVNHLFWLRPPPDELAGYLVLRAFAGQQKLQNPTAQLVGAGLLSAEYDWTQFEPLAPELIRQLEASGDWPAVEEVGATYLTPKRVDKLLALAKGTSASVQDLAALLAGTLIAPVRHAVLRQLIVRIAEHPVELADVLGKWSKAPNCAEGSLAKGTETARRVQAGLNLLWLWQRIEGVLAQALPPTKQPAGLLSAFVERSNFRLEADLAQLVHLAHEFGDDEVVTAIHRVAFGAEGTDIGPAVGSLKDRLRARLHELDVMLAGLVAPSPEAFGKGVWSSAGYLRSRLRKRVDELSVGNGEGRVWVLVFDGMRYDTWRLVVQPILAEHFEVIEDRPLFCVPPSFTTVARTSLLAGAPPTEWTATQESALAAANFGLSAPEAKTKFRFLNEAETLQARATLAKAKGEARLVNVLIYGISDDCHDFHGDLAAFHHKIFTDLTGSKAHGLAGIVDDLLRRVQPEDEVVLVSDHGFTELLEADAVEVSNTEADAAARSPKSDVHWRYTVGFRPSNAADAVEVEVKGEKHFLAVGRRWMSREGTKFPPRYSHGGVSLAEMVVPAVALKRVAGKSARAVLEDLPEFLELGEDQTVELTFHVRNRGTAPVEFTVQARNNLGEELLDAKGNLVAGETRKFSLTMSGRYREKPLTRELDTTGTLRALSVRLRHTNLNGEWHEPPGSQVTIPVAVKPKTTKLDTSALAGLDNL